LFVQIKEHCESVLGLNTSGLTGSECLTAEEQITGQNPVDLKKTQFLSAAEVSHNNFIMFYLFS